MSATDRRTAGRVRRARTRISARGDLPRASACQAARHRLLRSSRSWRLPRCGFIRGCGCFARASGCARAGRRQPRRRDARQSRRLRAVSRRYCPATISRRTFRRLGQACCARASCARGSMPSFRRCTCRAACRRRRVRVRRGHDHHGVDCGGGDAAARRSPPVAATSPSRIRPRVSLLIADGPAPAISWRAAAQPQTAPAAPRKQVNRVYPEYPQDALEAGIKGVVIVDITVNAAGDVSTAAVASRVLRHCARPRSRPRSA